MFGTIKKGVNKLKADLTLFSLELIVLIGVFLSALMAFIYIATEVFEGDTKSFDEGTFNLIAGGVSTLNTEIMEFFSFLGSHTFLIPANLILTAWFLFVQKRRWNSIKIPAVALSSLLLMLLLKLIFQRERPLGPLLQHAKGFSFPSGHALMSITFYGLMIFIVLNEVKRVWLRWLLSIMLLFITFFIGLSRIYLRVHYASDVLAGFCVGVFWLLLSLWILGRIEKSAASRSAIRNPNDH
ncbi:MAG: phosphatase PAP2 family protein [Ginsengibacter sp.]